MKKHHQLCLAKDELHYGRCPVTVLQYSETRPVHKKSCIASNTDHLGACLISRGQAAGGGEIIHAAYCTISNDLHKGPCRDEQGSWWRGTEVGRAVLANEATPAIEPDAELIGTTELKTWTPDSPRVELHYDRPDGLSIQFSAEIPPGNAYGPDDALAQLGRSMEIMLTRIREIESNNLTALSTNG